MLRRKAQERCVRRDPLPFRDADDERAVFRSHSSAETTTTLGLPFRVIVCGADCARSITCESRAFALATVQLVSSLTVGCMPVFMTTLTILTILTI